MSSTSRFVILFTVGLVMLSGGLVGSATAQDNEGDEGKDKVTFEIGMTNDVITFNPMFMIETPEYATADWVYDVFLGWDQKTMDTVPALGTSWKQSQDGLTWTFEVRDDAVWHDGEPLTAHDVAYTYNWILDEGVGAYIDYLPFTDEITAPDDTTLIWKTTKPTSAPLYPPYIYIMPEHILSQYKDKADLRAWKGFPDTVGSGPFELVEWRRGDFWRMEANPDYWRGAPKIDEVVFRVFQNEESMVQALKRGEIDFAYDISTPELFESLDGDPNITTHVANPSYFIQMSFNQCTDAVEYCRKTGFNYHPALRDPQVRLAIEYAIDRQVLVDRVRKGYAQTSGTVIINPKWAYTPPNLVTYDPDKANQILDEAGYEDTDEDGIREMPGGGDPFEFRFIVRTENPATIAAGEFIAEWLKAIGIQLTTEAVNDSKLTDIWYSNDYDMYIWGWGVEPDPNFQLSTYTTSQCGVWSDTCYSNPEYDKLFAAQQSTRTVEDRQKIVAEMQQILYDDRPEIVLWDDVTLEAYRSDRWTGFVQQPEPTGELLIQYGPYSVLKIEQKIGAGSSGGGGIPAIAWVAIIAGAAIIVAAIGMKRRTRREQESEV